MDPFKPASFNAFYQEHLNRHGKDNDAPIMDKKGHLAVERRGWGVSWALGGRNVERQEAFCRSVKAYYQREKDLKSSALLTRNMPDEVKLADRDIDAILLGSETDTLKQVYNVTKDYRPQARLNQVHQAEIAVVEAVLKQHEYSDDDLLAMGAVKAEARPERYSDEELVRLGERVAQAQKEEEIEAAFEQLAAVVAELTWTSDNANWEREYIDFMQQERAELISQCMIHLSPDKDQPVDAIKNGPQGDINIAMYLETLAMVGDEIDLINIKINELTAAPDQNPLIQSYRQKTAEQSLIKQSLIDSASKESGKDSHFIRRRFERVTESARTEPPAVTTQPQIEEMEIDQPGEIEQLLADATEEDTGPTAENRPYQDQFIERYQCIQRMSSTAQSLSAVKLLETDFYKHGGNEATCEDEIRRLTAEAETTMEAFQNEPESLAENRRQMAIIKPSQEYRYGVIERAEAEQQINRLLGDLGGLALEDDQMNVQLGEPVRQTTMSVGEVEEFRHYFHMMTDLHQSQIPGNSNCQSFCNSLEFAARGKGYAQVQGIKEALDSNTPQGAATPVIGWNLNPYALQGRTMFVQEMQGFFVQAVAHSQRKPVNDRPDSNEVLNGERYILLKTSPQGGAGHYVNMVRSKVSGRFFIMDGQTRSIYPVLDEYGRLTKEAQTDLDAHITVLRVDNISEQDFNSEIVRSQQLLKNAYEVQEVAHLGKTWLPAMPADGWASVDAGVEYLYASHQAQYQREMAEYQNRIERQQQGLYDEFTEGQLKEPVVVTRAQISATLHAAYSDQEWQAIYQNYQRNFARQVENGLPAEVMIGARVENPEEIKRLLTNVGVAPDLLGRDGMVRAARELSRYSWLNAQEIHNDLQRIFIAPTAQWDRLIKGAIFAPMTAVNIRLERGGFLVAQEAEVAPQKPAQPQRVKPIAKPRTRKEPAFQPDSLNAPYAGQTLKGVFHTQSPGALTPQTVQGENKRLEVSKLDDLCTHVKAGSNALVCIDIDDTLLARTVVGDLKTGTQEKVAIHPDTAGVLAQLRRTASDAKLIILSAGDVESTRVKLTKLGLSEDEFDGIVVVDITNGPFFTKSEGLSAYLDSTQYKPGQICLIDDEPLNHDEVDPLCQRLGVPFMALEFTGHREHENRVQYQNAVNFGGYYGDYDAFVREKNEARGLSAGEFFKKHR